MLHIFGVSKTFGGGGNPRTRDSGSAIDSKERPLLTVSRSFMNVANHVL
jgi:hypothetical protein